MRDTAAYRLSYRVLGVAMRLHTELGPGLLERVRAACLADDLELAGHAIRREVQLPLRRKGRTLPVAYRLDLLVDESLVVEIKVCARLTDVHERQVQAYLRLAGKPMGLLINFSVGHLRDGFRRVLPHTPRDPVVPVVPVVP